MTLGDALITPTKIYAKTCNEVLKNFQVNGMIHITGGGFFENIPRIIPDGLGVSIKLGSWEVPPIFKYIERAGNIDIEDMFATFNMGIGLMMIVDPDNAETIVDSIEMAGEKAFIIGRIIKGKGVSFER